MDDEEAAKTGALLILSPTELLILDLFIITACVIIKR